MITIVVEKRSRSVVIKNRQCGFEEAFVAEPTGLEPATSGVTGRHSNQLNYGSKWWSVVDSNH